MFDFKRKKDHYYSPQCIPTITQEEVSFLLNKGAHMGYYDEKTGEIVLVVNTGG